LVGNQPKSNPTKPAKPINKSNEGFIPTINNPEKIKNLSTNQLLITGNETLEDAFKADSQQNYTTAFQIYRHLSDPII